METTEDAVGAAARHARFGKLPERIGFDQMVEEHVQSSPGTHSYNPENSWNHFSCLALDMGL